MTDGFYTNDVDDEGCFGGYGSDGAWAYAGDTEVAAQARVALPPDPGAFGAFASNERRHKRFAGFRGAAGGSGGYGRAA